MAKTDVKNPRAGGTQSQRAMEEKIQKGREVIWALEEWLPGSCYDLSDLEIAQGKFFTDIQNGNLQDGFYVENFTPYHQFLFHEQTKQRFISIFYDFLSDCIHLKAQVKPLEVIRYEALQNGVEYLLTALNETKIERRKQWQDDNGKLIPFSHEDLAMNALHTLNFYAKELLKPYADTIDKYKQGTKISVLKADFYQKITRLAAMYNIKLDSQEIKNKTLGGKIVEYFNITDSETNN